MKPASHPSHTLWKSLRDSHCWNGPPPEPPERIILAGRRLHHGDFDIGIELSKTTFHLIGLSPCGEIVLRKKLSRKQLLTFTATRTPLLIGMEACAGAHYLARASRDQGHDARLMPGTVCKAVRQDEQERLPGRGSNCRSCTATDDAPRTDQDGRTDGSAGAAPGARPLGGQDERP